MYPLKELLVLTKGDSVEPKGAIRTARARGISWYASNGFIGFLEALAETLIGAHCRRSRFATTAAHQALGRNTCRSIVPRLCCSTPPKLFVCDISTEMISVGESQLLTGFHHEVEINHEMLIPSARLRFVERMHCVFVFQSAPFIS